MLNLNHSALLTVTLRCSTCSVLNTSCASCCDSTRSRTTAKPRTSCVCLPAACALGVFCQNEKQIHRSAFIQQLSTMDAVKGHWKRLTAQHLGKQLTNKWQQLMFDIMCIDSGLKPALLLDLAVPDASSMLDYVKALQHLKMVQCQHLKILSIGLDVLLVNMEAFSGVQTASDCNEAFLKHCVIDVSANLSEPKIIPWDSDCLAQTRNSFVSLMEEMQSEKEVVNLPLDGASSHLPNPSTLFGLFLDYPVVYWYSMCAESQENCLSMVPLVHYSLETTVKDKHGPAYISSRDSRRRGVIHSFSVPQALVGVTMDTIDSWFDVKKNVDLGQHLLIELSELKLERKTVVLPRVCL